MTLSSAGRTYVSVTLALLLAAVSLPIAGRLLAEGRPFRKWDPPAPQGVDSRLAYWTAGNAVFLETEARQIVMIAKGLLSPADKEYFRGEIGERMASPVDRELLRDPMPMFKPDGTYYAPEIPIEFNGRCILTADPDGTIRHVISQYREFDARTMIALMDRFGPGLSLEEWIYAGAPFRQTLWIANEKRSLAEMSPGLSDKFAPYPADTYLVAVDGARYFFETRLEGEAKDPALYPRFMTATWSDVGRQDWDPLVQQIALGFGRHAKLSPTARHPGVVAAFKASDRGEAGPVGEVRLWKQTMMQAETGPMPARLLLRNSRQALVLRDDGVVDIVEYPTAEDAEYLNGVEGFWTANHDPTTTVKYEAITPPVFSRDLAAIFRDYAGDEELIADLEAGLVPPPGTAPRDVSDFRLERLETLAAHLLASDERYVVAEVERLREAVRAEKMTMGKATARLAELQKRRIDPTDGNTPGEKLIKNWKRLRPDSPNPSLVAAIACYRQAWKLRGDGYIGDVDRKEAEGYGLFVDKCEGELDDADAAAPGDAVAACWRLMLGRSAGYTRETMDAIVARAVAADPNFSRPHAEMALYLQPRWHGEPGDVGRYVSSVVKRFRGQVAVDVFYQVYTTIYPTDVDLLEHGMFDRETLAAVAEDMADTSQPGEELWKYAEVFAYFSNDFRVAKKLIAKAGGVDRLDIVKVTSNELFPNEESADGAKRFFREASESPGTTDSSQSDSLWQLRFDGAGFAGASLDAALFNGGKRAMVIADPRKASIVNLETRTVSGSFGIPGLSLRRIHGSADGKTLILTGTESDGTYAVYRIGAGSGGQPTRLKDVVHREPISPEVLSADGKLFAKTVRAEAPTGKSHFMIWDATTGERIDDQEWSGSLDHPFFSRDGKSFTIWNGQQLGVYDIAAKKMERRSFGTLQPVLDPQYAPAGELFFFAMEPSKGRVDGNRPHFAIEAERSRIAVAASLNDQTPKLTPFPLGWRPLQADGLFAVSRDCRRVFVVTGRTPESYSAAVDLSAIDPGTIDVYEVATGERTHRLRGHEGTIRSLLYRDEDETLVTAATDGTLRVWDVSEAGLAKVAKTQGDVALPKKPAEATN